MGFSLFDEDDEENQRRMAERFMGPSQFQGGYAAPDPSLDPRNVQSFLAQRPMSADEAPPYPIPVREEPSSLGTDIGGALMGLGDIFANKGQNVPAITAGIVKSRANDRELSDQRFENDRQAYLKRDEQAAHKQQLELNARNADMRQLEIDAQRKRDADIHTRFLMGQDSPEAKAAKIAHDEALTKLALAQAARQTPGEDGLTAEERERGKDRDDDRATRAQIARDAAMGRNLQRQQIAHDKEVQRGIQQEKQDTAATNAFLDKTKPEREMGKSLQAVEPIVNNPKYKDDLPGRGWLDQNLPSWMMHPLDSEARQDSETIKQQAAEAYVYFRNKVSGAAFGKAEDADYRALKGLSDGATEEEFRNAMQYWKASVQNSLKGRATAAPRVARRALDAEGLGEWSGVPEYVEPEPVSMPVEQEDLPPMGARDPRAIDVGGAPRGQSSSGNNYGFTLDDGSPMPNGTLPVTGKGARGVPPLPTLSPEDEQRLRKRGIVFR